MMDSNQSNQAGNWTEADLRKLRTLASQLEYAQKIILIFIAVFTILGNTLVLVATWKERSLHQPNKYFIACLAFADLLVGIFLAPLQLYTLDLHYAPQRTMSIHLCRFMVWIDTFALTTSIYTLTLISFDRYLKISKPLWYMSRVTTSTSLKLIFIIVFISSSIASYAATPRSGSIGILFTGTSSCSEASFDEAKSFYTFMSIGMFFVPTGFILIMYVLIFQVAYKRQKMLRNGELGEIRSRRAIHKELKIVKMLMIVVGAFTVCWGPMISWVMLFYYSPHVLYKNYRSIDYRYRMATIRMVIGVLPLFNSLCNPIIYAFLDRKYKEAFKHLFQRIIRRPLSIRPQPTTTELPRLRTLYPR